MSIQTGEQYFKKKLIFFRKKNYKIWNVQSGIQRGRRRHNNSMGKEKTHRQRNIQKTGEKSKRNCVNPKWFIQTHTQSIFLSLYKLLAHFLFFILV